MKNLPVNEQYVILTGFPEEMKIESINAFMTQYLFQPKAEILRHPDYGFEIGELKIIHKEGNSEKLTKQWQC